MADNAFNRGFNPAHKDFGNVCAEDFEVLRGQTSITIPGIYRAISIDDLTTGTSVIAGGLRGDNTVLIFITPTVLATSGIVDGAVLKVRNKNVRVLTVSNDDDDAIMLSCGSAGVKM